MHVAQRSWTIGDLILGGSLVVGLGSVFLPWQWESFDCNTPEYCFTLPTQGSATGWGLLYFLVILDVAAFFFIRTVFANRVALPPLPVADWLLYLIAGVGILGVTLLAGYVSTGSSPAYTASVAFGWYVALLAAIAICAAALLMRTKPQPGSLGIAWGTLALGFGIVILDGLAFVIFVLILFFSGRLGVPIP